MEYEIDLSSRREKRASAPYFFAFVLLVVTTLFGVGFTGLLSDFAADEMLLPCHEAMEILSSFTLSLLFLGLLGAFCGFGKRSEVHIPYFAFALFSCFWLYGVENLSKVDLLVQEDAHFLMLPLFAYLLTSLVLLILPPVCEKLFQEKNLLISAGLFTSVFLAIYSIDVFVDYLPLRLDAWVLSTLCILSLMLVVLGGRTYAYYRSNFVLAWALSPILVSSSAFMLWLHSGHSFHLAATSMFCFAYMMPSIGLLVDFIRYFSGRLSHLNTLEAEVNELERKYTRWKECSSVWNGGIWTWNAKDELFWVSQGACKLLKKQEEQCKKELSFEYILERVHIDDFQQFVDSFQDLWQEKIPFFQSCVRIKVKYEEYRWCLFQAKAIREEGQVYSLVGTITDISMFKNQEKELLDELRSVGRRQHDLFDLLGEEKEEKEKLAEEHASTMQECRIHNQVITALPVAAQSIVKSLVNSQKRESWSQVSISAQFLSSLIYELLAFVNEEEYEPASELFSPEKLALNVQTLLHSQAKEKGIIIKMRCDPKVPKQLAGDVKRLQFLLMYFLGNAISLSEHQDLYVDLKVKRQTQDQAVLYFELQSPLGRSPSYASTCEKYAIPWYGEQGLGTQICRRIVEQMGGTYGELRNSVWMAIPFENKVFDECVPQQLER